MNLNIMNTMLNREDFTECPLQGQIVEGVVTGITKAFIELQEV